MTTCILCGNDQSKVESFLENDARGIRCHTCGDFMVTEDACDVIRKLSPRDRSSMSAFCRDRQIHRAKSPYIFENPPSPELQDRFACVTVKEIVDQAQLFAADRLEKLMLNIAHLSPTAGILIDLDTAVDYPLGWAENVGEFKFFLDHLENDGLIEALRSNIQPQRFRLTIKGWNYVDERRKGKALKPRQAFVVMWFDTSTLEAREVGFKYAIRAAGYTPLVIDEKDFNTDFHDEIMADIRRSAFVVADFTGKRKNVYFEAGFAEGLGKAVIYTCWHDEFEPASDIRQRNHILWTTPIDLQKKLSNRIAGSIGAPKD